MDHRSKAQLRPLEAKPSEQPSKQGMRARRKGELRLHLWRRYFHPVRLTEFFNRIDCLLTLRSSDPSNRCLQKRASQVASIVGQPGHTPQWRDACL